MADTGDLKSSVRKYVRVRIPPWARCRALMVAVSSILPATSRILSVPSLEEGTVSRAGSPWGSRLAGRGGSASPGCHLDLWAPNFGIQEWCRPSELEYEMFPGLPRVADGYLYPSDLPGLGIDIDESLAAEHPCAEIVEQWTQTRLPDGSPARP
jgi:hypothetical protein